MFLKRAKTTNSHSHACFDVSNRTKDMVLDPYKPNCRYVKEASISYKNNTPSESMIPEDLKINAGLSIPESCYIARTGHFNAVEFNIIFNQMGYLLFAESIKRRLMTPFFSWTESTYKEKQLPDVLIISLESTFRKEIQASNFVGEAEITHMDVRDNKVFSSWVVSFSDHKGGESYGKARCCVRRLNDVSERK